MVDDFLDSVFCHHFTPFLMITLMTSFAVSATTLIIELGIFNMDIHPFYDCVMGLIKELKKFKHWPPP